MKRKHWITLVTALALVLSGLLLLAAQLTKEPPVNALQTDPAVTQPPTRPTQRPTDPTPTQPPTNPTQPTQPTQPEDPPVIKEATATIGATGDILMHDLVIRSGYDKASGTFCYDDIFTYFSEYTAAVDYAAANLEVTLIQRPGSNGLLGYNGYPRFNSPDEVADALKKAGFDLLLTANNHAYDTGHDGFIRTQQVLIQRALDYLGTRLAEDAPNYLVRDINGIKVGMICYT